MMGPAVVNERRTFSRLGIMLYDAAGPSTLIINIVALHPFIPPFRM